MLDDDKPDYFLSDENRSAASTSAAKTGDPNVIDFGSNHESSASGSDNTPTPTPEKPRHRGRKVLVWTIVIGVLILGGAFYLRYFNPYVEDAAMKCYIVNVEKRGIIFKTYEVQAVSAESVADTSKIYSHPESFSITSDQVARQLQQYQGTNTPVTLRYEKFYATLPWRGSSTSVITSIEP